jgi:hypothetical protein
MAMAISDSPLTTPVNVNATPGVGSVTVSWKLEPETRVPYLVGSYPAGLSCHVVDQTSCVIPDTVSIPYAFYVIASKRA